MAFRVEQAAEGVAHGSNCSPMRFKSISVRTPCCMRLRYSKNDCRRCFEVCPENAISFHPGPVVNSACSECGLCVTACPTGVFRDERQTEQGLLRQAVKLPPIPPGRKRCLSIRCQKVTPDKKDSLSASCLGQISGCSIAALALLGFDEVTLARGKCTACRLKHAETLIFESIDLARMLLKATGRAAFTVRLEEDEGAKGPSFSRRNLFSPLSLAIRNAQQAASTQGEAQDSFNLSGRKFLHHLLGKTPLAGLPRIQYHPRLPWAKVSVDETRCSWCGICTAVCPADAMIGKEEAGFKVLRFDAALCSNCRLCGDACPENAVRFEDEFRLVDILRGGGQVVARVEPGACALCGDPLRASENGLCSTCRKRELTPLHVRLASTTPPAHPSCPHSDG